MYKVLCSDVQGYLIIYPALAVALALGNGIRKQKLALQNYNLIIFLFYDSSIVPPLSVQYNTGTGKRRQHNTGTVKGKQHNSTTAYRRL